MKLLNPQKFNHRELVHKRKEIQLIARLIIDWEAAELRLALEI